MSGTTFPTGPQHASPPPKDNTVKIVLIVLGVIALVALLLCAGLVGLGIYGVRQATSAVQSGLAEAIAGEILETPEAQQALGEVTAMRVNFGDLADPEQAQMIPVRVEGTQGSGVLQLQMQDGEPIAATLVMDDGQTIELPVPERIEVVQDEELDEMQAAEPEAAEPPMAEEPLREAEPLEGAEPLPEATGV